MHTKKQYATYIMASRTRRLYTGMTNDLVRRAFEHRTGAVEGFTKRYNITHLVYFELYDYVWDAIEREKQIKGLTRSKKFFLIESMNRDWNDLYPMLDPSRTADQPTDSSTLIGGHTAHAKNQGSPDVRRGDSSLRSE